MLSGGWLVLSNSGVHSWVLSVSWLVLNNGGVNNWVLLLVGGGGVGLVRSVHLGLVDGGQRLLWCLVNWGVLLWCLVDRGLRSLRGLVDRGGLSWLGWVLDLAIADLLNWVVCGRSSGSGVSSGSRWSGVTGRLAVNALLDISDDTGLVVGDLNDGGASNGVVVSDGTVGGLGEDDVRLASWGTLWDGDGVGLARSLERSGDWASDGDEVGTGGGNLLSAGEDDLVTGLSGTWGRGESWEASNWERAVLRGDGGDERSRKGDNLVEGQWGVEWRWERRQLWLLLAAEV